MYVATGELGITITPGEGVEDITEQIRAGWKPPAPPSGPAAPSSKADAGAALEPSAALDMPIETPIDTSVEDTGAGLEKAGAAEQVWYKSPWLWGGVAVLAVVGTLTAVYYRRRPTA